MCASRTAGPRLGGRLLAVGTRSPEAKPGECRREGKGRGREGEERERGGKRRDRRTERLRGSPRKGRPSRPFPQGRLTRSDSDHGRQAGPGIRSRDRSGLCRLRRALRALDRGPWIRHAAGRTLERAQRPGSGCRPSRKSFAAHGLCRRRLSLGRRGGDRQSPLRGGGGSRGR